MGSDYQFPRSLSDSGKAREPSFSAYLNGADGEISVFSADKYFNERIEDGQKAELNHRVGDVEGESKRSAVKGSKISLGISSTRSEYSWHSQSVLLRSFGAHVPGRHRSGEMPRKKSLLSSITCRCSCASKKSIKVDDRHRKSAASKDHIGARMTRADQLVNANATPTLASKPWMKNNSILYPLQKPSLHDTATATATAYTVENPSPESKKSDTNSSSPYTDSFDLPATGKTRRSMSHERIINLLNWDGTKPISEDEYNQSAISVEYNTDAESDSSSDLFEIESFTGHKKTSFSGQIPECSVSGCATPTTCPSVDWSIVAACAADFTVQSDCEELKPEIPVPNINTNTLNAIHRQNNQNAGHSLKGYGYNKEVRMIGNTDLQKTKENVTCHHQRMPMDRLVPFSRYHAPQTSSGLDGSARSLSDRQSEIL